MISAPPRVPWVSIRVRPAGYHPAVPDRPRILPDPVLTPAEEVQRRVKLQPRPDGLLQCPRCGGRDVLSIENGVIVKDGRRAAGTDIVTDACALCWKRGNTVQMVPGGQGPTLVT